MKLIFKYLSGKNKLRIFLCLICMIISTAFSMKAPEYSQAISVAISKQTATIEMISEYSRIVFLLGIGSVVFSILNALLYTRLGAKFSADLRSAVFKKVCTLDSESVDRFTVGSLITRTNEDVQMIQTLLLSLLQVGIQTPLTAVWALVKIQKTNSTWITSMAICIIAMSTMILITFMLVLPIAKKLRILQDGFNTVSRQSLGGVRVLRAFRADKFQKNRIDGCNENMTKYSFRSNMLTNMLSPLVSLCNNALTIVIYWVGAVLMTKLSSPGRAIIMGNMTAFIQYSGMVIAAFTSFVTVLGIMPETMISVKRIEELFNEKQKIKFPKERKVLSKNRGSIELNNVSFTYDNAISPCIKQITLTINPGEKIAVTGATGCGKTTFLEIIRRMVDVQNGSVKINGNNILKYTEQQISSIVSMAPQHSDLFSGNAEFNICYGRKYNKNKFEKALLSSHVDFIGEIPSEFEISQNGSNLSGGQKQRICLARTLYREADIYLLDDSFSALDTATERRIQQNIRNYYGNATVITVSQRVSTLRSADRIIVLQDGAVADIGTHDDLMKRCEYYRTLVDSQSGKEVIA